MIEGNKGFSETDMCSIEPEWAFLAINESQKQTH